MEGCHVKMLKISRTIMGENAKLLLVNCLMGAEPFETETQLNVFYCHH